VKPQKQILQGPPFNAIKTHADFAKQVPIRDYEDLKSYVDKVVAGRENVLWKGKPLYFAKHQVLLLRQNTFR
jgi:hypothetical protein